MRPSRLQVAVRCLAIVMVATVIGCAEPSEFERDLTLLPTLSPDAAGRTQARRERSNCVGQLPQRVALRGTVQREVRLGPPGYGETPAQDRRDTVLVLVPTRAIPVCNDHAIDAGGAPVIAAARLQLLGRVDPNQYAPGATLTVYGGFRQAVLGWHYTPVVLHVDSIVAGGALPRDGRRSSASGLGAPVA